MARGKQKLPGGDGEFMQQAIDTLGITQREMARILGFTAAGIGFCIRENSHLQQATKQEIRRRLAWHAINRAIQEGRALTAFRPCKGHAITDFTKFMLHFEQCPTCLARAYIKK